MLRIEALEKKVKDTETAANDWRVHAEMYKQKLAMHVGPTKEIAVEAERLKMDNKRLVGLLEGTDEFRPMMTKCAITRGQHYISLSECLVEEGWISEASPLSPVAAVHSPLLSSYTPSHPVLQGTECKPDFQGSRRRQTRCT